MLDVVYPGGNRHPVHAGILVSSTTIAPAVRMLVLVGYPTKNVDNEFIPEVERMPVVAIENRYFNDYEDRDGSSATAFTHQEAVEAGWSMNYCMNRIEPIICSGDDAIHLQRLSDYARDWLNEDCQLRTIACPWHPSEDDSRLGDAEDEMRRMVKLIAKAKAKTEAEGNRPVDAAAGPREGEAA